MATRKAMRPMFYEGQFLGAEDLRTVVDYGRKQRARHDLGAHTWGIAAGLDLVEVEMAGGEIEAFIQPGYAWDGFGREILLLSPFSLPKEVFKSISFDAAIDGGSPPGRLVEVWLRYDEQETARPAPGFETCGEGGFARVHETFQVEVGERGTHSLQHDPVEVAGLVVDASSVLVALDPQDPPTSPLVFDESIPYQSLPLEDDSRVWLIPVGLVRWLPGALVGEPGSFVARDEEDLQKSRQLRRIVGVVAQQIEAPQGHIRLRDRFKDPASVPRSDELVWVEGSLRIDEDLRMFGGNIDFRDDLGGDHGVPLLLHRKEENSLGGRDLRLQIGSAEDGRNRLVIGPETGDGFQERVTVLDHGKVGIGASEPEHDLQLGDSSQPVFLGLRGPDLNPEAVTLAFEDDAGTSNRWFRLTYDSDENRLNLKSAEVDPIVSFVRTNGRVGIGTAEPDRHLTVEGESSTYLNVKGNNGQREILLGADSNGALLSSQSDHNLVLRANTGRDVVLRADGNNTRMTVKASGRVGIGTSNPSRQLHVVGDRIRLQGGAKRIEMRTDGTAVDLHSETDNLYLRSSGPGGKNNLILNPFGADGNVGIGLQNPSNRLHVVDNINQSATQVEAHVALIENTSSGSNADVLALKVGSASPGESNNFITFFGGNSPVGRIERDSGSVVLKGTGSDYAEALPRLDASETMQAGDVVGVFEGKVTKRTDGAEQLMVISQRPIVVGNVPPTDRAGFFETVAFLGQVQVRVRGQVRSGDAIVPSGLADGCAIALSPQDMSPAELPHVIGTAWQSSTARHERQVKALVGWTTCHHFRKVLQNLADEIEAIRKAQQVEVTT